MNKIELYKQYLSAFNAHSLSEIEKCLSPDCTVEVKGKVHTRGRDAMLPNYTAHWERQGTPIEVREIKEIENGVWVILRDWDDGKELEVEYYYNDEGVQIKHNIKGISLIPK